MAPRHDALTIAWTVARPNEFNAIVAKYGGDPTAWPKVVAECRELAHATSEGK